MMVFDWTGQFDQSEYPELGTKHQHKIARGSKFDLSVTARVAGVINRRRSDREPNKDGKLSGVSWQARGMGGRRRHRTAIERLDRYERRAESRRNKAFARMSRLW